jgi:hypothetical protein
MPRKRDRNNLTKIEMEAVRMGAALQSRAAVPRPPSPAATWPSSALALSVTVASR